MPSEFPLIGELASLGAALSWAISVCTYRAWGPELSAFTLNFIKNTVAIVFLGATVVLLGTSLPADRTVVIQLALSGIVGITIGDWSAFAALRRLGAQFSTIGLCLGPPVAVLFGYFMMGEKLDGREWVGVIITLAGVLGVVYHRGRSAGPRAGGVAAGIGFLLLSGLCQGVGAVLGRQAMQQVDAISGTMVRLLAADIALIGYLLVALRSRPLSGFQSRRQFGALVAAAFVGTYIGLMLMSVGLKHTKAGVATAIMSTFPIWVIPIAVYFLGEKADRKSVAYTLVAAAGVMILVLS